MRTSLIARVLHLIIAVSLKLYPMLPLFDGIASAASLCRGRRIRRLAYVNIPPSVQTERSQETKSLVLHHLSTVCAVLTHGYRPRLRLSCWVAQPAMPHMYR